MTEHSVLAGHFAATAARVAASEGPILILQDTTEFIYSRAQPDKIGFTKTINAGRYKAGQPNVLTLCGVLMHSSLAVTLTGTPLGLTAVKFWTRTNSKGTLALKRHINPTRVPIETKESYHWLENLRQSIALVGAPERCVHVGDRESDIYELYCTAQDLVYELHRAGADEQAGRAACRCCPARSCSSRLRPTCGGALGRTSSHYGRSGRDDLPAGEVRRHQNLAARGQAEALQSAGSDLHPRPRRGPAARSRVDRLEAGWIKPTMWVIGSSAGWIRESDIYELFCTAHELGTHPGEDLRRSLGG
ncbi:hypothetical protein NKH71_32870 [Mesorhizobium sp. M0983]|uniref:hypothetical protein n=1 Tax=Mesorhizobium sp. M0983 TaxID=2957040 RepID=UPI00333B2C8F